MKGSLNNLKFPSNSYNVSNRIEDNFINNNYDTINLWWEKKETKKAREAFCRNYIRRTNKPIEKTYQLIKSLI